MAALHWKIFPQPGIHLLINAYLFLPDGKTTSNQTMPAKSHSKSTKSQDQKEKKTPMKSPRDINDVNAAGSAPMQPGAANLRPGGNSTNRGTDMTQSANTGRGVENDRSR